MFGSFLSSFILAFLVLSFVMTIGLMVQIVGYILDGVPLSLVGEFTVVCFPETLQWTMPLALLVASVLVFSRLSADSEIAAMRACGINLMSVMKWPIVFALLCTFLGIVVNNEIVPRGHEIRRTLKAKVSVQTGLDILEPGRVIDQFPDIKLYFSSKEGNWLHDLVVMDYSHSSVERMITASKALVTSEGRDIHLDLYQMTVDPIDADHPTMARANRFRYVVKDALTNPVYHKRDKDLKFFEIIQTIRQRTDEIAHIRKRVVTQEGLRYLGVLQGDLSDLKVEFSKRLVFACASICFVLVGIPLGIKAQRKESTIGMAISLAISLAYYMIVVLALGVANMHWLHPEITIFLPVVLCLLLSARLVSKNL